MHGLLTKVLSRWRMSHEENYRIQQHPNIMAKIALEEPYKRRFLLKESFPKILPFVITNYHCARLDEEAGSGNVPMEAGEPGACVNLDSTQFILTLRHFVGEQAEGGGGAAAGGAAAGGAAAAAAAIHGVAAAAAAGFDAARLEFIPAITFNGNVRAKHLVLPIIPHLAVIDHTTECVSSPCPPLAAYMMYTCQ